jgi:hypothetical protein
MIASRRRPPFWLVASLLVTTVACSGAGEEDDEILLPPPPTLGARCTDGVTVLPSGSVAMQCAGVSGSTLAVNLVITDTGSEQLVAAALDLGFNPPVATLESCSVGAALGTPVAFACDLANNNPAEILISVSRQTQDPGVQVTGSRILATLHFRMSGTGTSTLTFLGQNAPNGSALLRRDPGDPTQTQIIPGTVFPTGVTVASS